MEQLQPVRHAQTREYVDELPQYDEAFEKAWAEGITAAELKEYMHKVIASWPWQDR